MAKLNILYLVIGESGTGKDTIINALCEEYGYKKVISYTTRKPRYDGENTHSFITPDEFANLKHIVASTCFDGSYYCATQEQVDDADFYIIDKNGIESFREKYTSKRPYKIIYITADNQERIYRMLKRGDSAPNAMKRIRNDQITFGGVDKLADVTFTNDDFDETIAEITEYISMCENE